MIKLGLKKWPIIVIAILLCVILVIFFSWSSNIEYVQNRKVEEEPFNEVIESLETPGIYVYKSSINEDTMLVTYSHDLNRYTYPSIEYQEVEGKGSIHITNELANDDSNVKNKIVALIHVNHIPKDIKVSVDHEEVEYNLREISIDLSQISE